MLCLQLADDATGGSCAKFLRWCGQGVVGENGCQFSSL